MKPLPYQLIIFDWDGTLLDSQATLYSGLIAACDQFNISCPTKKQFNAIAGLSPEAAMTRLFPNEPMNISKSLVEHYRRTCFTLDSTEIVLFPQVRKVLNHLINEGYWLAIATGKSRSGLDRDLELLGLRPFFSATRTADEASSKPNPQMVYDILDELGLNVKSAVMIGDSEYDISMANCAGMDAVAVSYGMGDEEILSSLPILTMINNFDDLLPWLSSLPPKD